MKSSRIFQALVVLAMLMGSMLVFAEPSSTQPEENWRKVISVKGETKAKPKHIDAPVTTARWRVTVKADLDTSGGAKAGNFQVVASLATRRSKSGKAGSWIPMKDGTICQGMINEKGINIVREFKNGLNDKGEPQGIVIEVIGNSTEYEILVEDLGADGGKPHKKKKDD